MDDIEQQSEGRCGRGDDDDDVGEEETRPFTFIELACVIRLVDVAHFA